jgi:xanthine dehydrogenase accessory factor
MIIYKVEAVEIMLDEVVIVRGGGDIASGTIQKLHRCGFKVLVLEVPEPTSIRRKVSFSEAIYDGEFTIEGTTSVFVKSFEEIKNIWNEKKVPVVIDPKGNYINVIKSKVLVDAILAKKNLGTNIHMAPITIGLGPGFLAGRDVYAVIETMRGHNLGRIIFSGEAQKNTGIPGDIMGYSKERVIYSHSIGMVKNVKNISDIVKAGETIAYINDVPVKATIDGVLRGIIRDGMEVTNNFKIADIDPRLKEKENCFTISDKARSIAGGVLEAILYFNNKKS